MECQVVISPDYTLDPCIMDSNVTPIAWPRQAGDALTVDPGNVQGRAVQITLGILNSVDFSVCRTLFNMLGTYVGRSVPKTVDADTY